MDFQEVNPGNLTLSEISELSVAGHKPIRFGGDVLEQINRSQATVQAVLERGESVYGINTGFGRLANQRINADQLQQLQVNLILSHAVGVGPALPDEVVRMVLLLKLGSLGLGYSGVRPIVIEYLTRFFNEDALPCIPSQGSVGASGDLAPLAHLAGVLIGEGQVKMAGDWQPAGQVLKELELAPLSLAPKEGLALLNGTQVSTALALHGLFKTTRLLAAALVAGAMSVDAVKGSDRPFDARIQKIRVHQGQQDCATTLRNLLRGSQIRQSHESSTDCDKVQDPYSLRCQPQVMGACLDHVRFVTKTLLNEANAVSDNPLVFWEDNEVISGGNFHAEPVAMAADMLAVAIAEIGSLSERRIALLMDHHLSDLPPFLVSDGGLNSGFMMAQVTAAALTSENKSLAHPASVDSIPTSANQEDHVSMATFAARRLLQLADNSQAIIAIELLAAAQGLDFRKPLTTSRPLQRAHEAVRERAATYEVDRSLHSEIRSICELIESGFFTRADFMIPAVP